MIIHVIIALPTAHCGYVTTVGQGPPLHSLTSHTDTASLTNTTITEIIMHTYILAIESSCDDTSAAVLRDGVLLSNVTASQKVHEEYGGRGA